MPLPAEEFPIEEFDGIPDWNASAWALIQARDAKVLPPSQLRSHLATFTLDSLTSMQAVLTREPYDVVLMEAIVSEIERQRIGSGPKRP